MCALCLVAHGIAALFISDRPGELDRHVNSDDSGIWCGRTSISKCYEVVKSIVVALPMFLSKCFWQK